MALIDLDAMRKHHSQASFARAYARDRARFPQLAAGQRPLPAAGAMDLPATPPGRTTSDDHAPAAVDEQRKPRLSVPLRNRELL